NKYARSFAKRDCLTDPSPGPTESTRQISSTCARNLFGCIIYLFENRPWTDRLRHEVICSRERVRSALPNPKRRTSFADEVAPKRDRAARCAHFRACRQTSGVAFQQGRFLSADDGALHAQ